MINVRVPIISKLCVIQRLQQPRQHPALTEGRSHCKSQDMHQLGVTMARAEVEASIIFRRRHQRSHQSRKHTRLHSIHQRRSLQESHLVERMVKYHIKRWSFQDQVKKVCITGFLALQVHSKMAQSTNTKSKLLEGLYMDNDPDNRSEIITDITIRMPGKLVP